MLLGLYYVGVVGVGLHGADASNFRNSPVVETVLVLRVSVTA